jgi:ketosteroid isomerase-like protein
MEQENSPSQLRTRKTRLGRSREHHIRIYGDTAIAIGLWRAKGVNKGKPFDYSARYTSVWVKEGNRLRMISDQSTEIP